MAIKNVVAIYNRLLHYKVNILAIYYFKIPNIINKIPEINFKYFSESLNFSAIFLPKKFPRDKNRA